MRRVVVTALALVLAAALPAASYSAGSAKPAKPQGRDYYYEAAYAYAGAPVPGFQATLTVHKPKQVQRDRLNHSLGQIAVGQSSDGSYLEAGWNQERGKPRLFVFWRPANGKKTCYNLGCGFRLKGPGKRPGSKLKPDTTVTVGFQHVGKKWWFLVNGERSGFYPDRLWKGRFTGTDFAQVFGEVVVDRGAQNCTDMGNGQRPETGASARIYDATWIGGPPVSFAASPHNEASLYGLTITAPNAIAYGGPGAC